MRRQLGTFLERVLSGQDKVCSVGSKAKFGGHSMTSLLRRVAVCPPGTARWQGTTAAAGWRELGYLHAPRYEEARAEHDELCRVLAQAGAEVIKIAACESASLDAVYVHDPSFVTDHGVILLRMGRGTRMLEPEAHRDFYAQLGIPILATIEPPGTVESGDLLWLDKRTLLVGQGYRTNLAGISQLTAILKPHGVEVLTAPLPHGNGGPQGCLHLMSLMSLLDERAVLVDLPWLSVSTVQLLLERGFRLIEIDAAERDLLACNVLALGSGRLLTFSECTNTRKKLAHAGFEVLAVNGSEIGINGGGGPTCLTRPIHRDAN